MRIRHFRKGLPMLSANLSENSLVGVGLVTTGWNFRRKFHPNVTGSTPTGLAESSVKSQGGLANGKPGSRN
jgi:hypothetical protein